MTALTQPLALMHPAFRTPFGMVAGMLMAGAGLPGILKADDAKSLSKQPPEHEGSPEGSKPTTEDPCDLLAREPSASYVIAACSCSALRARVCAPLPLPPVLA